MMNFQPIEFVHCLKYMGVGMVTILAVIGVIILVTMALNRFTAGKKQD